MLDNISITISNYCSLQPYRWIPINRERYSSTVTWHEIKHRRQGYGKRNYAKPTTFNYRLSVASSSMFIVFYCVKSHLMPSEGQSYRLSYKLEKEEKTMKDQLILVS